MLIPNFLVIQVHVTLPLPIDNIIVNLFVFLTWVTFHIFQISSILGSTFEERKRATALISVMKCHLLLPVHENVELRAKRNNTLEKNLVAVRVRFSQVTENLIFKEVKQLNED